MLSNIFAPDEPVWLVAGGPSLRGFNFSLLDGLNVVAINKSFMNVPNARIVWWADSRFWLWNEEYGWGLKSHPGIKCAGTDHRADFKYPDYVHRYRFDGMAGLSMAPGYLRKGNNSAHAATNLILQAGSRKIRYLGVDMKLGPDGAGHHYDEYPTGKIKEYTLDKKMKPFFDTMIEPLRQMGAEVINCGPDSALECFPKRDFWDVLKEDAEARGQRL